MTREDAFKKLKENKTNIKDSKYIELKVLCYDLINCIYNNLEDQVCKNCKHLKTLTGECEEDKAYICEKCNHYVYCIDKLKCNDFELKDR